MRYCMLDHYAIVYFALVHYAIQHVELLCHTAHWVTMRYDMMGHIKSIMLIVIILCSHSFLSIGKCFFVLMGQSPGKLATLLYHDATED